MGNLIYIILNVFQLAIIARIVISWIPASKDNPIIKFIYQITEPVLAPIRRMIEKSSFGKNMMFDFSPIVVFLLIGVLRSLIKV